MSAVDVQAAGTWTITGSVVITATHPDDLPNWPEPPAPTPGGSATPPAAPVPQNPPPGVPDPILVRHTEVLGAPILDTLGRPVDWSVDSTIHEDYGRLQVVVEGVDISYLLGAPVPFPTITTVEPFGWASATITLPQVTAFHRPGYGDLAWCKQGANVEIRIARTAGGTSRVFLGVLDVMTGKKTGQPFTLACTGLLFAGDKQLRPPTFDATPKDAGQVIADVVNSVVGRRYQSMAPVVTGCLTAVAGSWEPRLTGYVQQLLATMVRDGRQWTIGLDDTTPVLRLKDTTTVSWSCRFGQRGIDVDLEQDDDPNVIYGEGIGPDGGRWRNARYPNWRPDDTPPYPFTDPSDTIRVGTSDSDTDTGNGVSLWQARMSRPVTGVFSTADRAALRVLQRDAGITVDGYLGPQSWATTFATGSNTGALDGAFIAPLAAVPQVEPRLRAPDGADRGDNPAFDPAVLRIEDMVNFGQGVSKDEGLRAAAEMLARDAKPGWHGQVTFTLDPPEGHRLEVVTAGSNGLIHGVHGQDLQVHVAQVQTQPGAKTVTVQATVDTKARDYPTLDAIRTRERNAVDPAKAYVKRASTSSAVSDRATFDAESPAGQVPRHAVFSHLWTVLRIPFGAYGSIVRTEMTASDPAREFVVAVFDRPITAARLTYLLDGDPLLNLDNPWSAYADDLNDAGLLQAWGWTKQPCGYYPGQYVDPDGNTDDPLTGRLVDDASWTYLSQQSPWLWVAEFAGGACYMQGRFYPGVD